MALPPETAGVLLTGESAGSVVEGSLAVLGSQRSEGGFTIYRIVFKVVQAVCHGVQGSVSRCVR